MAKPFEDTALSFLSEHSTFKSSKIMEAVQEKIRDILAKSGQAVKVFQIPIAEKLLSYEKALLWLALIVDQKEQFPEPIGVNAGALMEQLAKVYDLDHENLIVIHTFEDEESDEESGSEGEEEDGEEAEEGEDEA